VETRRWFGVLEIVRSFGDVSEFLAKTLEEAFDVVGDGVGSGCCGGESSCLEDGRTSLLHRFDEVSFKVFHILLGGNRRYRGPCAISLHTRIGDIWILRLGMIAPNRHILIDDDDDDHGDENL